MTLDASTDGDGNGWTRCEQGHRHWGLYGAAGLLLRHLPAEGPPLVLLQHRALWSHHGGTWGVPGGARDSAESAEEAALREASEESDLDPALVVVDRVELDDHGGWAYATVLAHVEEPVTVRPRGRESLALRWVPVPEVEHLDLHPGFAASWPELRP